MLLNTVLALIVLFIALICLTVALRAFGVNEVRGLRLTVDTGLSGERFTRSMGAAASCGAWPCSAPSTAPAPSAAAHSRAR